MYSCDDMFLYDILEDYKDAASGQEQDEIFRAFCSFLWSSPNKRKTCAGHIRYQVRSDLLDTKLGQLFHTWSDIPYARCKSTTRDDAWRALIRQKINNLYTRYFDPEVILNPEYMELLKTPKRLYYEWIHGASLDAQMTAQTIDEAMQQAKNRKERLQMEKMSLPWNAYKKIIEVFLRAGFERCRRIDEYENAGRIVSELDLLSEDHFYVRYLCRRLEGNIKDYQKEYYGLKRNSRKTYMRCRRCGALLVKTGNRRMYCAPCQKLSRRQSLQKAARKYRNQSVIQ